MKLRLEPGKYIAAISGGVDSVVLLDLLNKLSNIELIIAHFDHGIRPDSADDVSFVKGLAMRYGNLSETSKGKLGPTASEAIARQARYNFLHDIRQQHNARAIITAHHQDDVLETLLINILRGTGRKGLSSLSSSQTVVRPLLNYGKHELIDYATNHRLKWREDSTNQDSRYLRNWLRQSVTPLLTPDQKRTLLAINHKMLDLNQQIDEILIPLVAKKSLNRHQFIMLPHDLSAEVVAQWLRQNGLSDFTRQQIDVVTVKLKTLQPGKVVNLAKGTWVEVDNLKANFERQS